MKRLILLLIAIIGWLQYSLWLGKNGLNDHRQIQSEIAALQEKNDKLKIRNERLFAEINDLHGKLEAIEERARNELGMVKPGESYYRIVSEPAKSPTTP